MSSTTGSLSLAALDQQSSGRYEPRNRKQTILFDPDENSRNNNNAASIQPKRGKKRGQPKRGKKHGPKISATGRQIKHRKVSEVRTKSYFNNNDNTNGLRHQNDATMNPTEVLFLASRPGLDTIEIDGKDVDPATFILPAYIDISHLKKKDRRGLPTTIPGITFTNLELLMDFMEDYDCCKYDKSCAEFKKKMKSTGNDELQVKFRMLINYLKSNCYMYLWDGYHFRRDARKAKDDRDNGVTPFITSTEFNKNDMRFTLISPFFTDDDIDKVRFNRKTNPKWWPKSWD